MKKTLLSVALLAAVSLPVLAQNIAVVNGKPVPTSRVEALKQQVERSGRPVTPEMMGQIKEELIAREVRTTKTNSNWPVSRF
jgi:peptidyl-prolyl cis-trans isomerase C